MPAQDSNETIHNVDFQKALGERYLSYALSTIMARSLPDVRDGLKPVHRRLIYAMQQLRLNPNSGFKKCARVVGDVMGKFHPHGDAAIYGALVRLAQDFSVRYPLIDGQGNFGNIDGDAAAAMRYTEARLSEIAIDLMDGLDEDAVDFRTTYDGESAEPIVFPAAFPNLLANGATGIAVGMATSIPPHNLYELCCALRYLIDHPEADVSSLQTFIPAPDFPTGGVLVESSESIHKAYETGRGSFRLRARWHQEDVKGSYRIVITEIPYMVEKSRLIEKIADLLLDKKLPLLDDIQDESADDIRIVLVPKNRTVPADVLMESLFRATDLDTRIPLNMNVLDANNVPRVMSLKEVLVSFLDHRLVVLKRRTTFRLSEIARRLEILGGYLIAYLNLDEVIRIIRESDDPKQDMMDRFHLTEVQTEAILNMRLRALRKLQEIEIRKEHQDLSQEQTELEALLAMPKKQWQKIHKDLATLQKRFGPETVLGKRRTTVADVPVVIELPQTTLIEKEDVTLFYSEKNWIRALKGHNVTDIKYKEGDQERFVFKAQTTDRLILFSTSGRFYTILVDKLPRTRGGFGEAIRLLIDLPNTDEILSAFIVSDPETAPPFLVVSSEGKGFLAACKDVMSQTKAGKQVLVLSDQEKAFTCLVAIGDHVAMIGQNRKLIAFPMQQIPSLSKGKGVTLQKYKDGAISDLKLFNIEGGLSYTRNGKTTTLTDVRPWISKRAGSGRLAPIGFSRTNKFQE